MSFNKINENDLRELLRNEIEKSIENQDMKEVDKEICKTAHENDCIASPNNPIHPLIFISENNNPTTISAPLISGINFDMIGDSNLEIFDSLYSSDFDLSTQNAFNLGQVLNKNIRSVTYNNIVEFTLLSFYGWWKWICSNIGLEYNDSALYILQESFNIENKSSDLLKLNIMDTLDVISNHLSNRVKNIKENNKESIENVLLKELPGLINICAVNLANTVAVYISKAIYTALINTMTNPYDTEIFIKDLANKSEMVDKLYQNKEYNKIQIMMNYMIKDKLYDFTLNSITPSIDSILNRCADSLMTLYRDYINWKQ